MHDDTMLQWMHRFLQPKTYIEINVGQGAAWQWVTAQTVSIGIDPKPDLQCEPPGQAQLFVGTSAAFFQTQDAAALLGGKPCELALIGGRPSFAALLHDFCALEAHSAPGSTILIEHCLPSGPRADASGFAPAAGEGDAWKLVLCLKQLRPDVRVVTIDANTSSVAVVMQLDPLSTVLRDRRDEILRAFVQMPTASLGSDWQKRLMLNVIGKTPHTLRHVFGPGAALVPMPQQTRHASHAQMLPQGAQQAPATRGTQPASKAPQLLGVLLCYNDADVLEDALKALLDSDHKVIAWDHGSCDGTSEVLDRYQADLLERRLIPRDVDFYNLYEMMSRHLLASYTRHFDWVSWPDQDEILEGPDRTQSYKAHLVETYESAADWIIFRNMNFWFTKADDAQQTSPIKRVRHYSIFPDCAPRIRSWRATSTNIRHFNHNPPLGRQCETPFNLRHYPMRSYAQMQRRLTQDRANLERAGQNFHYSNMQRHPDRLLIAPEALHVDDGQGPLRTDTKFDWWRVYGASADKPREIATQTLTA